MKIKARIKSEPFEPDNDIGIITSYIGNDVFVFDNQKINISELEILDTIEYIENVANKSKGEKIGYAILLINLEK
jgi:hypothetical protein